MSNSVTHWQRSSFCADHACIELTTADGEVLLRSSKDTDGPVLRFSGSEWEDFRVAVAAGEFEFD
jgi:hypothetical protein